MILGVLSRDEGDITWNGGPLGRDTIRFGYMPEERGNLSQGQGARAARVFRRAARHVRAAGVGVGRPLAREAQGSPNTGGYLAEKLSKGNQQKVQLIATILHDPELIFLDEPFSGLDPINTDVFKSVIGELIAAGKTIVMSSHQMATVEEYCRDLVLLDRGKRFCRAISVRSRRGMGIPTCRYPVRRIYAPSPRHTASA